MLSEISPSTISRIEREELDPTWGTLSRILDASGYRISEDSLVSAGDPSAIAAARLVVQSVLAGSPVEGDPETGRWIARWVRAGWFSDKASADDKVLLSASTGSEPEGAETEGGIRFVSREQGVLDAFAGSGREPDKAEDTLRHLLSVSA